MQSNRKAASIGRAALLLAAALVVGGGCEKQVREAKNTPATAPQQSTAVVQAPTPADVVAGDPETAAATVHDASPVNRLAAAIDTQPVLAFVLIDGLSTQFPPTKLRLATPVATAADGDRPAIACELFSDLPKSALRRYDGNELLFDLKLEGGAGPQRLDGASWKYKSTSSEKADSANGIFLNGQQTHLQPSDAHVRFVKTDKGQLVAQIWGQFRAFQNGTPESLAPLVDVRGELPVEVVVEKQ